MIIPILSFFAFSPVYSVPLHHCKSDADCFEPYFYCYESGECVECTNCLFYNRLASSESKCAKNKDQCGLCILGMKPETNFDKTFTCQLIPDNATPNNLRNSDLNPVSNESNNNLWLYISILLSLFVFIFFTTLLKQPGQFCKRSVNNIYNNFPPYTEKSESAPPEPEENPLFRHGLVLETYSDNPPPQPPPPQPHLHPSPLQPPLQQLPPQSPLHPSPPQPPLQQLPPQSPLHLSPLQPPLHPPAPQPHSQQPPLRPPPQQPPPQPRLHPSPPQPPLQQLPLQSPLHLALLRHPLHLPAPQPPPLQPPLRPLAQQPPPQPHLHPSPLQPPLQQLPPQSPLHPSPLQPPLHLPAPQPPPLQPPLRPPAQQPPTLPMNNELNTTEGKRPTSLQNDLKENNPHPENDDTYNQNTQNSQNQQHRHDEHKSHYPNIELVKDCNVQVGVNLCNIM